MHRFVSHHTHNIECLLNHGIEASLSNQPTDLSIDVFALRTKMETEFFDSESKQCSRAAR
jgi:hypothetical protein